ncbi:MAG: rRNA ((966)-N(2))-methyltransferase RsmD [Actinomycetota bacterium]
MSRIIAGSVGSLRLSAPAKTTRPTADRVKESLFSALESASVIEGSKVLDLFAGTAALGLEAISRGARSLTSVEKARAAAEVCRKNIEAVAAALQKQKLSAQIQLIEQDCESFLKKNKELFDLVLIDPPYDLQPAKLAAIFSELKKSLSPDALVVLEKSSRASEPEFAGYEIHNRKQYGDTEVLFIRAIAQ